MAMFGFVYIWYLMAVLLLEIWFDHRKELILRAEKEKGLKRLFFKILIPLFKGHLTAGAGLRQKSCLRDYRHRHTLCFSPPRICRVYIRFRKSKSLVVQRAYANRISFLGHSVRNSPHALALYDHYAFQSPEA